MSYYRAEGQKLARRDADNKHARTLGVVVSCSSPCTVLTKAELESDSGNDHGRCLVDRWLSKGDPRNYSSIGMSIRASYAVKGLGFFYLTEGDGGYTAGR